jgi:hypothetical protein
VDAQASDQRRYQRFTAEISATLRLKDETRELNTVDVSRHGAFFRTTTPRPVRELVQVRFHAPTGDVDVMCMVVRSFPEDSPGPVGPGMGVDFFAISKEAKDNWDAFIRDVQIRGGPRMAASHGAGNNGAAAKPATPPPTPPDDTPMDDDAMGNDSRPCFMLRIPDREKLRGFLGREVSAGGMFLPTPVLRDTGEIVDLVLVHPESGEDFHLEGKIVRVTEHEDARRRGMSIRFHRLTGDVLSGLTRFIEGEDVLELTETIEPKPATVSADELRRRVTDDPDNPAHHHALGVHLLSIGDAQVAIDALTRALILGPDSPGVHEALSRAHLEIGDNARSDAHKRVAKALQEIA